MKDTSEHQQYLSVVAALVILFCSIHYKTTNDNTKYNYNRWEINVILEVMDFYKIIDLSLLSSEYL